MAIGAAALASGCGCSAEIAPIDYSRPGELIRLSDGRQMNWRCTGKGAPLVLLEAGFGADSQAWAPVQPMIAARTRVCAYDRAGYGFSDPGPLPRDGAAVARDVDMALSVMKQTGPVIVVGHSAGALYGRLLAARRSRQVIGMVLVDPTVERQEERFAESFGPGAGSFAPIRAGLGKCLRERQRGADASKLAADCANVPVARLQTEISEIETLGEPTSQEVQDQSTATRHIPLVLLTAIGREGDRGPGMAAWVGMHEDLAKKFDRATLRQVRSSHLMIGESPSAILSAIEFLIAEVRPGRLTN